MIKLLAIRIANLKILYKILLCMLVIAMSLAAFLGLFSSLFFGRFYREDAYTQTADSIQVGSQALEDSWHQLLFHVIETASSPEFILLVNDAHNHNLAMYGQRKSAVQEPITTLTLSNSLLDSVVILGKNGEFYSLFTNSLKKGVSPSDYFGLDFSAVHGITWFPVCEGPFSKSNLVIPVVLPIRQMVKSSYLNVAESPEDADIFIFLFLDSQKVEERLALGQSSYANRTMYIASQQGASLSLTRDSLYYELSSSDFIMKEIQSASSSPVMKLIHDGRDYTIYSRPLSFSGLSLICILPKDTLYERLIHMNLLIAFTALAGLVLASLMALKLSQFVTKPFQQLITNVKKIENNTYDVPYEMSYNDEVGHLNQAINSMYDTIQLQFVQIKETERAKFRSEIQLLSEQINPHFLYNTLECINMEVLGGHREEASSMITSLSDFLRIGLSYGNEMIPIEREIAHVKAYIDIMNRRFNRKICFSSFISPSLQHTSILKLILQPLAENSIRHGFDQNEDYLGQILMPSITVEIHDRESHILLEVSDNGSGIDLEKANAALHPEHSPDGQKHHVGLSNIYQRLMACYGDVSMTFESIPFFRNTVRIMILKNLSHPISPEADVKK